MSNGLDPDQDCHSVCPDLGPNCLQTLFKQMTNSTKVPASRQSILELTIS